MRLASFFYHAILYAVRDDVHLQSFTVERIEMIEIRPVSVVAQEREKDGRNDDICVQSSEDDFVESRVERASDAVTVATAGSYVRLLQLRFLAYAC